MPRPSVRRFAAALGGSLVLLSSLARATPNPPAADASRPAKKAEASRTPAKAPPPHAKAPAKKSEAKPARPTRTPDTGSRRQVAGGATADDAMIGADTPELRMLHAAERELFPHGTRDAGGADLDGGSLAGAPLEDGPRVSASGLPPAPASSASPPAEGGRDLSWLSRLALPDLPVRWDARVIRYLEFYKDDPRGRAMLSVWLRRAGRYRDMVHGAFRKKSVPEDLLWLAMIESGFEPTARSPVGALGLWQFMPDTGRAYGLWQDRWVDQRLSVTFATEAAAEHLSDLHRRFGSWELAIASYNMGYGGILAIVRRYNTNDFWALSRLEGALPWETTLYVPKVMAAAIVGRNLATFGFGDLAVDPPLETDEVSVPPGTSLGQVAQAAACTTKEIEQLNLELRASRTPTSPGADYPVRVPMGRATAAVQGLAKGKKDAPLERYVVRFGESLEQIAAARHVSVARLVELNGIAQGEVVRGGTALLVPRGAGEPMGAPGKDPRPPVAAPAAAPVIALGTPMVVPVANGVQNAKDDADGAASVPAASATMAAATGADGKPPVVAVPTDIFVYPDRRRVFYRVTSGDTLADVAGEFHVSVDEVRRWNDLDPAALLQEGMTLQLFVPNDADLSHAVVLSENEVKVVPAGSEEFATYWEGLRGKKRIRVSAKAKDTLESIGRRYGVSAATMERINRRGRFEALKEGVPVVLYVPDKNPPRQTARRTQ
jgi:membrane-bound lytic murein transglycosylase D